MRRVRRMAIVIKVFVKYSSSCLEVRVAAQGKAMDLEELQR